MWGNGRKAKSARISTLIGHGTEIRGDVHFTGGLHVDGTVRGSVIASDDNAVLSVSENGQIVGEVRVPNLVLNGVVEGDVHVKERVELAVKARVIGNVYYNLIEMAIGAEVNGNLVKAQAETHKLTYQQSEAEEQVAPEA